MTRKEATTRDEYAELLRLRRTHCRDAVESERVETQEYNAGWYHALDHVLTLIPRPPKERKRKCDKCPSPNGCDTCKAQFYPNLLGERKRGEGE